VRSLRPTETARRFSYSREALDITDFDAVMSRVQTDRPDVIINCAAYNDVEGAEDHADEALTANAFAVRVGTGTPTGTRSDSRSRA
jgi:dTDP-4-dehydrorhamnose reductase